MKKSLIQDYLFTFGTEQGKNVQEDLRKKCPTFDRSGLSINPNMTLYQAGCLEGQRSVLLYIYKVLGTDPYAEQQKRAINKGE